MIKINECYEIECLDLSFEALGVCKIDNFIIFVPNLITEEKAIIKIIKLEKNFGFGEIVKLIKPSKFRNRNILFYSGGTQLSHITYDYQLKFKEKVIKDTFKKILNYEIKVNNIISMKNPYYYRNKIKIHIKNNNNKLLYGFYENNSNNIVPINNCIICSKKSNEILKKTINLLEKNKIYNINQIIITEGFKTNEVMIIFNSKKEVELNKVIEDLKKDFIITTIIHNINEKVKILYGPGYIFDILENIKLIISSKSFYQVNPSQTEKLYEKAKILADLNNDDIVIDAYSGIGTISLYLSKFVKKIYGIEIIKDAVEDAKENAKINKIKNVEFIYGNVEKEIKKFKDKKIDVIFLDPPRKGCSKSFLNSIIYIKPKKIIYISCNVTTQAKDILYLKNNGYNFSEAFPVDMFPHTHHIENIIKLEAE